ncbi:hypothetical protein FJV46_02865 [Arthrobacter agilis]|uniref:hypothetical protein n=1 Tax=Arthrobacter agilis TaxID=37921 RepID=UPI000B363D45|nr:hypothetical protein [Arthrobacter agilis]OUM41625.1 hypothetical protein B8W74_12180 [Arthrobacter agilis]PPB47208.1 hypothetical protein CI784_02555 [Arthrobacter agilis]TPV26800.1 hypothetical protein FJV46_02865 [Arthrobacter agilis]VDR33090.1 Uncharacterised protein [Arthrobacter agilis]
MATPLPPRPFTLRAALILWLVISVLLGVAAGTFITFATLQDSDRAGFIGLGTLFGALAILQLLLLLPLRRGRRSARELLSTVGIIVGVPILVRGTPGLSLVAGAMLVAVLLMWLPQSSDYFQLTQPRAKKRLRLPGSR